MKHILSVLSGLLVTACSLYADLGIAPHSYVTVSWSGTFYFEMLPPTWNEKSTSSIAQQGFGTAYRLNNDGTRDVLWRVEGWYSPEVYLSADANHLVRLEREIVTNVSLETSLAIAFYDKGKLLRQYSLAQLIKDRSKLLRSVSYYKWLAGDIQKTTKMIANVDNAKAAIPPTLRLDNSFILETCDGTVYVFDVASGEIVNRRAP